MNLEQPKRASNKLEVITPSIEVASDSMFHLAEKLVNSGKAYDLILSDDASGRLVSLYVKKILDAVNESKNLPRIELRFVAAGRHGNDEVFKKIAEVVKNIEANQVLLVTEHIATGDSIVRLMDAIKPLGIKLDLAALSIETGGEQKLKNYIKSVADTELFYGESGIVGLGFWSNGSLSGVVKNRQTLSPFPEKAKKESLTKVARERVQKYINYARKDIDLLADQTIRRLGLTNASK